MDRKEAVTILQEKRDLARMLEAAEKSADWAAKDRVDSSSLRASQHGRYADALDMAISALSQPNEPLTPDQLRGMYGEPVWVTSARERGNIPSRWVLFAGVSKSKRNSDVFVFATTGGIAQGYEAVNYGKTWNAYRRPLGGEEDA